VALSLLVGATLAGCADGRELAVRRATEQVRASAHGAREQLRDLLSSPRAPAGGQALADHVRYHMPAGPNYVTFHREVHEHGRVVLRLALTAEGVASNWIGGHIQEFVRLCVQLSGARSARAAVDLRQVACDASAIRNASPEARTDVTVTVPLQG
jgi:hypothetical protein